MWQRHREVDALVVGGGPVGLLTALCLSRAGMRPLVADARWKEMYLSGSVMLHAQSLAILAELGLAPAFLGEGMRVGRVGFYDEQGMRHGTLELSGLDEPFPFAVVVPEQALVDHLDEALADRGVPVKWHHRLGRLEEGDGRMIAHLDRLDRESVGYAVAHMEEVIGRSVRYNARRVVGADGHDSDVRRYLGGRWERVGDEGIQVIFELTSAYNARGEARVIYGEHGISTLLPLSNEKIQLSFFVDGGTDLEPLEPDDWQAFLRARAPWFDNTIREIDLAAMTPYQGRISTVRGQGSVWLVGNAAHAAAPILDYPLNAGLAEARDLATQLATTIENRSATDALKRTADEFAGELYSFLRPAGRFVADENADSWVRNNVEQLARCIPARQAERDGLAAQIGLRQHA